MPDSLRIIFWELVSDLRAIHPRQACPSNGCLRPWTEFCLLWNVAPTCQVGKSGSHLPAWRRVTRRLLREISEQCEGMVFIAWGTTARQVVPTNLPRNRLIYSFSPSPRSAYRNSRDRFVGSRPFTRAAAASPRGLKPADWRL
jgi:uracil-DNA glycosylase